MINALQICSYYSSNFYKLLFKELSQFDINSTVYYFAENGTQPGHLTPDVKFSECYGSFDRLFFKKKEDKVLQAYDALGLGSNFDIAHAHSLFANGYIAYKLKKRYGIPYVVAVRNTDVNVFFKYMPWLRKLGLDIMKEASHIVFISPSYKSAVFETYVPNKLKAELLDKTDVIPNGINSLFTSQRPPKYVEKQNDVINLIQVGDVCRNKNQAGVIAACRDLEKAGYQVKYHVVGKVIEPKIGKMLAKKGAMLNPVVSQVDLIDFYRSSDVFIMPSYTETFGLSYIEAMSQGLPVIFSIGQGIDGYFEKDTVGFAVNPSSPKSIAEGIIKAYNSRVSMRNTCIDKARDFDWKKIAGNYHRIYSSVLASEAKW